ncbi:MAG: glycosyltransferase family 2 protein [Xanthobacteraceae bacterium]
MLKAPKAPHRSGGEFDDTPETIRDCESFLLRSLGVPPLTVWAFRSPLLLTLLFAFRHPWSSRRRIEERSALEQRLRAVSDIISVFDAGSYRQRHARHLDATARPLIHYVQVGWRIGLDPHIVFRADHYRASNPELSHSAGNPFLHFMLHGWRQGRSPHPLFELRYYGGRAGVSPEHNPLVHYLSCSVPDADPHPLFDTVYYRKCANHHGLLVTGPPLLHYLDEGAKLGCDPHPLFDTSHYLAGQPEALAAGEIPLLHYVTSGASLGTSPHPLFDPAYYRQNAAARGHQVVGTALADYLQHGAKLDIDPHVLFRSAYYRHTAGLAADAVPLVHYVCTGSQEQRSPHPLFDPAFYLRQLERRGERIDGDPLAHFLRSGAAAALDPHPLFDTQYYVARHPDAALSSEPPFLHYLRNGGKRGESPHPLFDPAYYRARARAQGHEVGDDALLDYLQYGAAHGIDPHILFLTDYYGRTCAMADSEAALSHYVRSGGCEQQHSPHPLFDSVHYTREFAARGHPIAGDPLIHYLHEGALAGVDPHPLFDTRYYLAQLGPTEAPANPLVHFLACGSKRGLRPNAAFDGRWYAERYADVRAGGLDPFVHYILFGRAERRRPSEQFDADRYLEAYPDLRAAGVDPIVHYVRQGYYEGRPLPEPQALSVASILPSTAAALRPSDRPVDVVIPVYAGIPETRRCISSVLASASDNTSLRRIIVVDDSGPEPGMAAYLQGLQTDPRITLITNERNFGFVTSANRGMAAAAPHDVILLNSDTEVAHDWVDRLAAHAYADATNATVTPFSNNAGIVSYPKVPGRAELSDGQSVTELDAAFRLANRARSVVLPTGVGFCLFIKRACLAAVGPFDEAAFGRGYGEEVDFCLRAAALGWRNILAADTFVYHVGETSFGAQGASARATAGRLIRERYPDYDWRVARFLTREPLLPLRVAATAARCRRGEKTLRAVLMYRFPQYSERHASYTQEPPGEPGGGKAGLLLIKVSPDLEIRLSGLADDDALDVSFRSADVSRLAELVNCFGIEHLQVHLFLGRKNEITGVLTHLECPYDLTLHNDPAALSSLSA